MKPVSMIEEIMKLEADIIISVETARELYIKRIITERQLNLIKEYWKKKEMIEPREVAIRKYLRSLQSTTWGRGFTLTSDKDLELAVAFIRKLFNDVENIEVSARSSNGSHPVGNTVRQITYSDGTSEFIHEPHNGVHSD
jgi:hypothetical protein